MNENRITAKIITDSINETGQRLTTFILNFPRIVLAEFNTHRMFSRNSASSRAIPFKTMVEKVKNEPFIPIRWQKDHSGMQGIEYFTNKHDIENRIEQWLQARNAAVVNAEILSNSLYVTKQLCNRLLEPFLYHTVIVTGTEWENFFALRAHPQAEIHIADLAEKMLIAYNSSTSKELKAGEWHIPFGDTFDEERISLLVQEYIELNPSDSWRHVDIADEFKIKIATARCARISYNNFEGKDDYKADLRLHDTLSNSGHWSPFEHCAKTMNKNEFATHFNGNLLKEMGHGWFGNFKGFIQYRKMFENENKKDSRILLKN